MFKVDNSSSFDWSFLDFDQLAEVVQPFELEEPFFLDATDKVIRSAIKWMQLIVEDSSRRMAGFSKDIKLLNHGIYSGNKYFEALKEKNLNTRIEHLRNSGSFFDGYAPPSHFNRVQNPNGVTGKIENCFVVKPDVLPSEAIDAIKTGPTFLGHGELSQIVYCLALKEILGDEKFNALFDPKSKKTALKIHFDTLDNSIRSLFSLIAFPTRIEKGDVVIFENLPEYKIKHYNGEASAVMALSEDGMAANFSVLGIGTHVPFPCIEDYFLFEINKESIGMQIVTEEMAKKIKEKSKKGFFELAEKMKDTVFQKDEFEKKLFLPIPALFRLDRERVNLLESSPVEKVSALFKEWNS